MTRKGGPRARAERRGSRRATLVAGGMLVVLAGSVGSAWSGEEQPPLPTYRIRTETNARVSFAPAVIGVPTPVDVDGDSIFDVTVRLLVVPAPSAVLEQAGPINSPLIEQALERVRGVYEANVAGLDLERTTLTLTIDRILQAEADLAAVLVEVPFALRGLKIEALLPTGAGAEHLAFGYATDQNVPPPASVETTLSAAQRRDGFDLHLDAVTRRAGSSLRLLGELYDEGPAGPDDRLNRKRAALTLTPVPTLSSVDLRTTATGGGGGTTTARLTSDASTKIDLSVSGRFGAGPNAAALEMDGTLDRLAGALTTTLTQTPVIDAEPPGAPATSVSLTTLGPRIARAELTIRGADATTWAEVRDLPTNASLTLRPQTPSEPQTITVDGGGQVFEVVDVARATGTPRRLPDAQYAYLFRNGADESVAARITGLADATLQLASRPGARAGDLIHASVRSSGGPFKVVVSEPAVGRSVVADVRDLPADARVTLRPNASPTLRYQGSGEIASATISVHDEAGIARSVKPYPGPLPGQSVAVAKDLEVVALGLPTDLTASFEPGARALSLTATDARPGDLTPGQPADIDSLTVRLSDGPLAGTDRAFADGLTTRDADGALVRDMLDRLVVFARVRSLSAATLGLGDDPLEVRLLHGSTYGTPAAPARPFEASIEAQSVGNVSFELGGGFIEHPVTRAVEASVSALPRDVTLTVRKTTTPSQPTIRYLASSTVDARVAIRDEAGISRSDATGNVATDLVADLLALPGDVSAWFTSGPDRTVKLDVSSPTGPVGRIDIRLWRRAPGGGATFPVAADEAFVTQLGTHRDGVLVRDISDGAGPLVDRTVTFARIGSLRNVSLTIEGQRLFSIQNLRHTPRPFLGLIEERGKSLSIDIDLVPDDVTFSYRPTGTPTVFYSAASKIGSLTVRLHDEVSVLRLPNGNDSGERGIALGAKSRQPATDLRLAITDLPGGVNATLSPAGSPIELSANAPIGRLDVQLWRQPAGTTSDLLPNADDRAWVDQLTIAPFGTPIERDGVLVRDVTDGILPLDDRYVVFARISKLRSAYVNLDPAAPDVRLVTDDHRDVLANILQITGGVSDELDVSIGSRPTCMRIGISASGFASTCTAAHGGFTLPIPAGSSTSPVAIMYEGSGPTGSINVNASPVPGTPGKNLMVALRNLPVRVEAVLVGADRIELNTIGGTVGSLSVDVANRWWTQPPHPDDRLGPTEDGVLLRTKLVPVPGTSSYRVDRDVLHATLTGLRAARIITTPSLDAWVDADPTPQPPRAFRFDQRRDVVIPTTGGHELFEEYARAGLVALQRDTRFTYSMVNGPLEISYSAASAIPARANGVLGFITNAGVADALIRRDADIDGSEYIEVVADSLPTWLTFCMRDRGHACGIDPFGLAGAFKSPSGPTMRFEAAAWVPVRVTQCLDNGTDHSCNGSVLDNDKLLTVNLTAREAALQVTDISPGRRGFFLDTDFHGGFDTGLGGTVRLLEGTTEKVLLRLPSGFGAQDVTAVIRDWDPLCLCWPISASGELACPTGTEIWIHPIPINIAGPVCAML